jgi:hypothetical protein
LLFVAILGSLAFVLSGSIVGLRLLRLGLRSRQLPEIYLGGSLLSYAAIGQPLVVAYRPVGQAFGYEALLLTLGLALSAISASAVCLYLFTRTVYRPNSRVANALVWLVALASAISGLVVLVNVSVEFNGMPTPTRFAVAVLSLVYAAGMFWTSIESLQYFGKMRKRLAVGLAEPLVTNRFLLWGIGCGTAGSSSVGLMACAAVGLDIGVHPVPLLMTSGAGLVVAVCWALAFLPPRSYCRWVELRAADIRS